MIVGNGPRACRGMPRLDSQASERAGGALKGRSSEGICAVTTLVLGLRHALRRAGSSVGKLMTFFDPVFSAIHYRR